MLKKSYVKSYEKLPSASPPPSHPEALDNESAPAKKWDLKTMKIAVRDAAPTMRDCMFEKNYDARVHIYV